MPNVSFTLGEVLHTLIESAKEKGWLNKNCEDWHVSIELGTLNGQECSENMTFTISEKKETTNV